MRISRDGASGDGSASPASGGICRGGVDEKYISIDEHGNVCALGALNKSFTGDAHTGPQGLLTSTAYIEIRDLTMKNSRGDGCAFFTAGVLLQLMIGCVRASGSLARFVGWRPSWILQLYSVKESCDAARYGTSGWSRVVIRRGGVYQTPGGVTMVVLRMAKTIRADIEAKA